MLRNSTSRSVISHSYSQASLQHLLLLTPQAARLKMTRMPDAHENTLSMITQKKVKNKMLSETKKKSFLLY